MRRVRLLQKTLLTAAAVLGGGVVLANGCANLALSITPCGTILAFCSPGDQANLIFQFLDLPDFNADPSCTIPLACGGQGGSDLLPPLNAGGGNPGPSGGGSTQPPQGQGGAGGGFGGGGGGGAGGGAGGGI